jgi:uncharacterized protein
MELQFEWDEKKATTNISKHGVSFEEAKTVFNDPNSMTIPDPEHSINEERWIDIGLSTNGKMLIVSYTERGSTIRIISCRKVTARERKVYEYQ